MAKISQFQADAKLASGGIEVPFGEADDSGKQAVFIVGYAAGDAYRNKLAELMRRASRQLPGREIPQKTVGLLQRQAMIDTVLLGWKGLTEEDGTTELPFTPENAAMVLGTPTLYAVIEAASNNLALFQKEEEAASKAAVKSGGPVEPALE